jgi:ABC-2 type transport system ATP-binding protein
VNLGAKMLDGSVQEVKQQFKENKFYIRLTEPVNNAVSNAFTVVEQKDRELTVCIEPGAGSNDILSHFINQRQNIEAFHEILPSLNEIFIRLVEGTHAAARAFQNNPS